MLYKVTFGNPVEGPNGKPRLFGRYTTYEEAKQEAKQLVKNYEEDGESMYMVTVKEDRIGGKLLWRDTLLPSSGEWW
jgi:hypothetical protein